MAFINLSLPPAGLVNVYPPIVYINTTDSLSTVTTAGYLNEHASSFEQENLYSGSMCVVSNTTNVVDWLVLTKNGSGEFTLTSSSSSGSVTSINTNNGLTGGPITTTGTIGLAPISNNNLLANISGSTNPPSQTTLTALMDDTIGNQVGSLCIRGSSSWTSIPPSSSGKFLQSNGTSSEPSWENLPTLVIGNTSPALTGGTTFGISATGVTASSTVVLSIKSQASSVYIESYTLGTDLISVTFSGTITNGQVSWIALN